MPAASSPDPRPTIPYVLSPAEPATVDDSVAFSSEPATTTPGGTAPPAGQPSIPGYRLLGEIARGGMGAVYTAQDLTLRREVAIKVLLPALDSESAATRFVREAEMTACLPHPGIPPVHALGTLADGAPYLVMKLIRGQTLADLLRARTMPGEELARWVQVFEQIAQAVGFAHAQGIIHRDLKPLNVMVGAFGEVQVMDWGLAKSLADARPENPVAGDAQAVEATQAGTVLGTPGYMAPEQARGEQVDARADVFALGGILTTILTGQAPFVGATARATIAKAATADLADALARLDACAADEELRALTKRCLAANPADRPADARVVARDVASYRAGVESRLRQAEAARAAAEARELEQAKRRRTLRTAAAAIATVLVVGMVGTSIGLVRATNAAAAEKLAAGKEKREREFAQAIANFVKNDFLALTSVEGQRRVADRELYGIDKDATLKQLLDRAAAKLDERQDLDPRIEAELRWIVGVSYRARGEYQRAIPFLERCVQLRLEVLGPSDLATLMAQNSLAVACGGVGNFERQLALYEEIIARANEQFGPEHQETLGFAVNRADALRQVGRLPQAMAMFEHAQAALQAQLGPDHDETLNASDGLADTYLDAGRTDEAIALYEQIRAARSRTLGADDAHTLQTVHSLARAYRIAGQTTRAIELFELGRNARARTQGEEHPQTLESLNGLAGAYQAAGKTALAIELYEQVRAARTRTLGPDHRSTLATLCDLAGAYQSAARLSEAIPLFEQATAGYQRTLGADSVFTLTAQQNLARAYHAAGRVAEAITIFEQVRDDLTRTLGADHPHVLTTMGNLATAYWADKRLAEAIATFERLRAPMIQKFGAEHPDVLALQHNLGLAYREARNAPAAIELLEGVKIVRLRKLGPDHPDTLATVLALAVTYGEAGRQSEAFILLEQAATGMEQRQFRHEYAAGIIRNTAHAYEQARQFEKAESWRRKWLAVVKQQAGAGSPAYAAELTSLGQNLMHQGKWAEAELIVRECLAIRTKSEPDSWTTSATQSLLGAALLRQEKYAEAEPLLLQAHAGLQRVLAPRPSGKDQSSSPDAALRAIIHPRMGETLDRLVALYTALNKPDEVKRWQAERDKHPAVPPLTTNGPR